MGDWERGWLSREGVGVVRVGYILGILSVFACCHFERIAWAENGSKEGDLTTAMRHQKAPPSLSPFGPAERFLWFYRALDREDKALYEAVYRGLYASKDEFYVTTLPKSEEKRFLQRIERIFLAVMADHPELFWVEWFSVVYDYLSDGRIEALLSIRYRAFQSSREEVAAAIEAVCAPILEKASQLSSDFEKERYLYAWMQENIVYDKAVDLRSSILGVFLNKRAACGGFARAFQYLMMRAGIPATHITGEGDERHSWNLVEIGGSCYNVDTTTDVEQIDALFGKGRYLPTFEYLNMTDSAYEKASRVRRDSSLGRNVVKLSPCKTRFSYERTFGIDSLYEYYRAYVDLKPENVIRSLEEHFRDMKRAGMESSQGKSIVFEIVLDKSLKDSIVHIDRESRRTGYLDELWQSKYSGCTNRRTSASYGITATSFLVATEEEFICP